MEALAELLVRSMDLKKEPRRGWVERGIENPESVAGHSWGVALLCVLLADEAGVDRGRALALAVVHDLAETETGDVIAHTTAEREAKREREREALESFDPDAPTDLLGLWEEYERGETPEARFVKDMDLIEACLQAAAYGRDGRGEDLNSFFETAKSELATETGRDLLATLRRHSGKG